MTLILLMKTYESVHSLIQKKNLMQSIMDKIKSQIKVLQKINL